MHLIEESQASSTPLAQEREVLSIQHDQVPTVENFLKAVPDEDDGHSLHESGGRGLAAGPRSRLPPHLPQGVEDCRH